MYKPTSFVHEGLFSILAATVFLCCRFLAFHSVTRQPYSDLGRIIFEVSRSHTIRHTHSVTLLWTSDQLVAEGTTYTTQFKRVTNIHALSGIRTHNPNNRLASGLRLIRHDHRYRCFYLLLLCNSESERLCDCYQNLTFMSPCIVRRF